MVRTQIQLTENQMQVLRRMSAEHGRSVAELIRNSVDEMIEESERTSRTARFLSAVGRFNTGPNDVSENHDDYLADAYAE